VIWGSLRGREEPASRRKRLGDRHDDECGHRNERRSSAGSERSRPRHEAVKLTTADLALNVLFGPGTPGEGKNALVKPRQVSVIVRAVLMRFK
jgi:hypothetical protein